MRKGRAAVQTGGCERGCKRDAEGRGRCGLRLAGPDPTLPSAGLGPSTLRFPLGQSNLESSESYSSSSSTTNSLAPGADFLALQFPHQLNCLPDSQRGVEALWGFLRLHRVYPRALGR